MLTGPGTRDGRDRVHAASARVAWAPITVAHDPVLGRMVVPVGLPRP